MRHSIRRKAAIPDPQICTHTATTTYFNVSRAVHCGRAAASALAPSAPMLLLPRLWCQRGYWSMRHSIRRNAAIPAPKYAPMRPQPRTRAPAGPCTEAVRPPARSRLHRRCCCCQDCGAGVAVIGPCATPSGARRHPSPPNTLPCDHTHVLERLQGRALRQGGRQRARALIADVVVAKTVVPGSRLLVHGPHHQAQGAIPAPQIRSHATTPTY